MTIPTDNTGDAEPAALEALLRWYVAMGVDFPVSEAPRDCFALSEAASVEHPPRASAAVAVLRGAVPPVAAASSADALAARADALAASATTLDELRERWASLPGCGLAATASRMIFEGGVPGAALMFVGGAPDSDDERQGEAFSGAKGRLLDAILSAIGLSRSDVYLSNVIPWRPPGNRVPTPLELGLCLPFARRQIELAAPKLLVCLGDRAAQPLLSSRDTVSKLRGRWVSFEGRTMPVKTLVTFSLDYLLKQPLQKRRAWADMLMVSAQLRS